MITRTTTLLTIALLAALLSACGAAPAAPSSSAATTVPAASPANQATTIKMWYMPNGPDPDGAMQAEIKAFQALNPNITIESEQVSWSDALTRIQTVVQGAEGPCITQLGTTWVPGFTAMGGLRPFSAEEIQAMGGADSFVKASWETSGLDGQVTAIPWFADVRAIAYRADVLDKVGLKPADAFKDLEAFETTLTKIKEANLNIAPLVHPGRNDWNVWQNASMWIWAHGGDILNADHSAAVFNTNQAVKGVTAFNGLFGKGLTAPNTLELNSAQVDAAFGNGEAAVDITGPWIISQARAPKDQNGWQNDDARKHLAFAEFPAGPAGKFTFVGGSNLAIFNNCPNPDAAVAFIKHLVGRESQVRFSQAIGMLPAQKTAQADAAFADDPLYSVFIAAAANGRTSPPIADWSQVESSLQTELQALWEDVAASAGKPIDEATVKVRLDAAADTVKTLLSK